MVPVDVVGLGLSTVDILMRLSEMPTWEAGGDLRELGFDGGGPVGTALVAAARLGASTGYVGTCGSDEIAALKLHYLSRDGVDISHVVPRSTPERQMIAVYVHSKSGERVFASTHSQGALLAPDELDRDYINSAEYLLLDGFHPAAALQAAQWRRAAGKPVVLDAARTRGEISHNMMALVELSDVLICGSGFSETLTGMTDWLEAGEALRKRGPWLVVQTEGAQGCYTSTAGECFHTPAFKVDVVDTTGAGDVFHGAYIIGLLKDWGVRRIATFAAAVSAIKCTHLGGRSGIPGYTEVQKFLVSRGEEIA